MAVMNVDHILGTFNQHGVSYLLIGGMNFLLRHLPVTTYDVDLWIEDQPANRLQCEAALAALDAEWGQTDADWGPVARLPAGWLDRQGVYSLNSPHGAIDVFRSVHGLPDWPTVAARAIPESTQGGIAYHGICDEDMLQCQLALDPGAQNQTRVTYLRSKVGGAP
jgi:hypothetical protein